MQIPRIGLTMYAPNENGAFYLPFNYSKWLTAAGGTCFMLAPEQNVDVERWLDNLDALLISGGGDLAPESYNGTMHPTMYKVSPVRDACEFALLDAALKRNMPVFCICRGFQVFNVLHGGSVCQDIEEKHGTGSKHRFSQYHQVIETVHIEPGSRLSLILEQSEVKATLMHHQCIDKDVLANGLEPVAFTDDGIIMALEKPGLDNVIAVQWHPEMMYGDVCDPVQFLLFEKFIEQAKKFMLER